MPASVTAATTWGAFTRGAFNWGQAPWNAAALSFAYDSERHRVEMTSAAGSTLYFNDPASGATAEYYVPATGEEQMAVSCLINLNARVYDPILGRFLSGDPVIGNISDGQVLNRYGYVHGNPLSLSDANGQCPVYLFVLFG